MRGNSRRVESTQPGIHHKLDELVVKYQTHEHQRPVSEHTQRAFDQFSEWVAGWSGDLIIDSCCGVGQSTSVLANRFPDARILGLDKSALRINKHVHYQQATFNYRVLRADVNDFWRLLQQAQACSQWRIVGHYLLYPNPYPKASQVQKRWHSSPAMPHLMAISPKIEVRSNWLTYLHEFARACELYGKRVAINKIVTEQPVTPFEQKYLNSGQDCWRLLAE